MTPEIEIKIQELRHDLEDGEIDHHEAFEVLTGAIETSQAAPAKDATSLPILNWRTFVDRYNVIDALIRDKWGDILAVIVSTRTDSSNTPHPRATIEGWEPDVEDPDKITLKWNYYWPGSHEDRDSFDIPAAILTDRNAFEAWAKECQAAHLKRTAAKERVQAEAEEREARQQYADLRERFEGKG